MSLSTATRGQELYPFKYGIFDLGTVTPGGWLKNEINLSGRGLGGHLFYFYRFVKQSTWLGGTWEYTALNEAAPYWYNYIVPLAFMVSDDDLVTKLRAQATHFLEYTLEHQTADGWLGPEQNRETRGFWARCLLLPGLINHALAEPQRLAAIVDAILRFTRLMHTMLKNDFQGYLPGTGDVFDPQWFGVVRAHELSLSLQWLYGVAEIVPEDRIIIWEVMELMWEGSRKAGRDWTKFFNETTFPKTVSLRGQCSNFQHGVNVAQGLRYPAQLFRMHPAEPLRAQCFEAVDLAFRYHGTPSGSLSSDEYVGGLSPTRGAELCCAVELQFSLSYLYRLFQDGKLADRVESVVFNAFPAGISPNWWSHQYITQINQPWACEIELKEGEKSPWYDVCRYANVFGLEPEFPCCTVNHPTALPKLAMNTFLPVHEDVEIGLREGILHSYLVAGAVKTRTAQITCTTTYPFSPLTLSYEISAAQPFHFYIRVPGWATNSSTIRSNGTAVDCEAQPVRAFTSNIGLAGSRSHSLHEISVPASEGFKIEVNLHADVEVRQHGDNGVTLHHGPLLYALDVEARETSRMPRKYKDQRSDCDEVAGPNTQDGTDWMHKVRDYDLLPADIWAVALDLAVPPHFVQCAAKPIRSGLSAWTAATTSSFIEALVVEVDDWPVINGVAADPRDAKADPQLDRPRKLVKLVPFGCTRLHMAQFPVLGQHVGLSKLQRQTAIPMQI